MLRIHIGSCPLELATRKENSKRTMRLHCSAVQVTVWGVREYAILGEACEA